jgi:hypothetical protein
LFLSTYSFPVPIPTLKDIIRRIKKQFPSQVEIFSDNYFNIASGLIADRSEEIKQSEQEINVLATVFDEYCKTKSINYKSDALFSFIESSKKELVSFVSRQSFDEKTASDSFFLDFIKTIEACEPLIKTFRKLIMGSVISSYFEIRADKTTHPKIFLLDTNFIVSLLDLHTEESRITTETLIDIALRNGHSFYVLPETINETQKLLERKARALDKFVFLGKYNLHTIEEGCRRRSLGGRELRLFAERLIYFLQNKKIKIISEKDNNRLKDEAPNTEPYKKLREREYNKDGVLHDVMMINYIRNLRGNNQTSSFKDSRGFIVKDSNAFLEEKRNRNTDYKSPSIEAEYLLNILWLSTPIFDDIMLAANLSRMLSSNLRNQLPDGEMLTRIDEKIGLFANFGIDNEACLKMAQNIAETETDELTELAAISEQEIFNRRLAEIAEKSEAVAIKKEEETKEILINILHSLDSQGIVARNEITLKMEAKIKEKEDDNQNLLKKQDIEHKKDLLLRDKEARNRLKNELDEIQQDMDKRFNIIIIVVLCFIISTGIIVYRLFQNSILEGYNKYFPLFSFLFTIFILFLGILARKKISNSDINLGIKKILFKRKIEKAYKLEDEIKKIERRIRSLEDEIGEKSEIDDFEKEGHRKFFTPIMVIIAIVITIISFFIPLGGKASSEQNPIPNEPEHFLQLQNSEASSILQS